MGQFLCAVGALFEDNDNPINVFYCLAGTFGFFVALFLLGFSINCAFDYFGYTEYWRLQQIEAKVVKESDNKVEQLMQRIAWAELQKQKREGESDVHYQKRIENLTSFQIALRSEVKNMGGKFEYDFSENIKKEFNVYLDNFDIEEALKNGKKK
jgi:hypothetical protein